jgi:hypothetical protein
MTINTFQEKRWPLILLIGCLSMFMAEVFAGSSQMWFIDIWSLLVTYWLYLAHLLLFLNLAIRMKRTSISQLYLYGVLFALYESWITKVLWSGYPGSEGPAIGLVGGIAILEFCTLVFFWHPILSFIMPILVFESFAISNKSSLQISQKVFVSHLHYLKKSNKKVVYFYIFLMILGATFLSLNTRYNIIVASLAVLGSIGLIYLFLKLSTRKCPNSFSIYSLKLGNKGLLVVIIYLISLYFITFIYLMPQNIPKSIIPFFVIIGFYLLIIIIIRISKQTNGTITDKINEEEFFHSSHFFKLYIFLMILTFIFCLIPIIALIIGLILFLGIFLISPFFFIMFLIKTLKK